MSLVAHIPLDRAMLCLDCESIFASANACPACGNKHVAILAVWVKSTKVAYFQGKVSGIIEDK